MRPDHPDGGGSQVFDPTTQGALEATGYALRFLTRGDAPRSPRNGGARNSWC